MASEKRTEKDYEPSPERNDGDHQQYVPPTVPDDSTEQKDKPSGIIGLFSKLGDLPEWSVPGIGQLQGAALNWGIAACSCTAFLMFGYDQGVLSGILTLDDFNRHFPLMTPLSRAKDLCWLDSPENTVRDYSQCTGTPNTQAAVVAMYQIGCFLGAVLILFYGEVWGRKSSSFWGSVIMIIGTILQVAPGGANGGGDDGYAVLVVGRVVGGIGNGMVTASKFCLESQVWNPSRANRRPSDSDLAI
jgi:hypothetical protein